VLSRGIHPQYRQVVRSHVEGLGAEVVEVETKEGITSADGWTQALGEKDSAAIAVVQSPNFFGCIEDGAGLLAAAREAGALGCVVFNPIALGLLATPGQWGADIAVGEGQPLGLASSAGGETLGLFAARKEHMWKMPGRLVGLTRDRLNRRAYVLTLQSREQHIRRARATSNICSNQALYALMAAIYMATVGPDGLRDIATICGSRAAHGRKRIAEKSGLRPAFSSPTFHEFVLRVGGDAEAVAETLARDRNVIAGYPLGRDYPELRDCLLVCATEMTTTDDIDRLADALASLAPRTP
jgi:glycine dehydrogenase subunit 1